MKPKYFAVQQAGREADIYIFGDIVADRRYEEETSAFSLKETIKGLDADTINVYIDSYGGSVSDGWAIYNELRRHSAKVRTFGTGFVASAALYPFMAGDERYAMDPSAYFFHQILVDWASGNADDLRKAADELEKLNEIGRAAFTNNTKLTAEDVLELEKNNTWLSPQEALELGIATAILTTSHEKTVSQSSKRLILQKVVRAPQIIVDGDCIFPAVQTEEPLPAPEPKEETPPTVMQLLGNIFNKEERN